MAVKDSVLSSDQVKQYHETGFLLVPNVFSPEELKTARKIFLEAFNAKLYEKAPNSNPTIINDIYSFFPGLVDALYPKKYFNIIKDLIGSDLVWIPECSIHRNRYIHWHKDTSVQELNGELSHRDFSKPLIQAALYFQDNDHSGGGLTLIPHTHNTQDPYYRMLSSSVAIKVYYKILKSLGLSVFHSAEKSKNKIDVLSTLGSLLLFDLRIDHRSTTNLPGYASKEKLAIFNTFGEANDVTKGYFDFMKKRPEPYYRYFQEYPLPDVIYQKGLANDISIWY